MKNPNSNPLKGFLNELTAQPKAASQQVKKPFTWHKPVVAPDATQPMNTPRRLQEQSAVAKPKSSIGAEYAKFKAKKKGC